MSDHHQSLSVEKVRRDLGGYCDLINRNWGRIEIVCETQPQSSCVLISKAELSALEQALEFLCELPGGKEICAEISRVAEQTTHRAITAGVIESTGVQTDA